MEHMLVFAQQKKACADDVVRAGFNDMIAVATVYGIHSCFLLLSKNQQSFIA